MHYSNFEVDGSSKVDEWLKKNEHWKSQSVWKPKEHPTGQKHDTFRHIYELGNDKDNPIEIEDDGFFSTFEYVTDQGIIRHKARWQDLSDYEKKYWQEDWWYEKPWEMLRDPGESPKRNSEDE